MRAPVLALLALAGCNLPTYDLSSATADASTSTSSGSTVTTSTSDPTDATSTGDPPNLFTPHDLPDHPPGWCDFWNDSCPLDQKCMPGSLDGDNAFENLRCVPIAPMPDGLYEPCTVLGTGLDGLDTCDRGQMCLFVDPGTKTGTCFGFCNGSPNAPGCADPGADCTITEDDPLICYPRCDPLAQDCGDGYICVPNANSIHIFTCLPDASGDAGQVFELCEYADACDPGLLCLNPKLATECDPKAAGCCLPFCDTSQPNTCPGAGQECLPWYEEGQAPPNYEHVGVCGLP